MRPPKQRIAATLISNKAWQYFYSAIIIGADASTTHAHCVPNLSPTSGTVLRFVRAFVPSFAPPPNAP